MKQDPLWFSEKGWLKDQFGRIRILRGMTVSGTARTSGRPFPEEEADSHFMRLSQAGCTFLRWALPWNAVEHDGPEEYDEEYLAYLRRLLKKAEEYGISVYMEPFQSTFSQLEAGDGAPDWVFRSLGFNTASLAACGAVVSAEEGSSWAQNYQRYAAQTLFTLFFAGDVAAPHLKIDGDPVQYYLQTHFIDAMNHTARRLKDCTAIAGFGLMNAPSAGYMGIKSLDEIPLPVTAQGVTCSPFEGMKAASGFPAEFYCFRRKEKKDGYVLKTGKKILINSGDERTSAFLDGFQDPWKAEGVWAVEDGTPVLKRPDWFAGISFSESFAAFQSAFMEALQKKHSHYLFFTEGDGTGGQLVRVRGFREEGRPEPYDLDAFLSVEADRARSVNLPLLVNSDGVSFSAKRLLLNRSAGYKDQETALAAFYDGLDRYLLSCTLESYTPSNTLSDGDGWNGRNTSVWSADDRCFRAEKGFVRPYVLATAGTPIKMRFLPDGNDTFKKTPLFEFEWDSTECSTSSGESDTEIFVPKCWFPNGWKVEKFEGAGVLREDAVAQRLFVKTLAQRRCFLRIISK